MMSPARITPIQLFLERRFVDPARKAKTFSRSLSRLAELMRHSQITSCV